jgi:hypothetical protein
VFSWCGLSLVVPPNCEKSRGCEIVLTKVPI